MRRKIKSTPYESDGKYHVTPEELAILQHTLGLDKYGRGDMYRNFFCAGGADEGICRSLVAMGYMQRHATTAAYPYFNCSVTDAGKYVARHENPPPPKLTRGQRRYREYLHADFGMTFIEWLRWRDRQVLSL